MLMQMTNVRALILEYEPTEEESRALQSNFDSPPDVTFQIERNSLKTFREALPSGPAPQIIILNISGERALSPVLDAIPSIKQKFPDVPILAVMEVDDAQRMLKLLEAGADDFVQLPNGSQYVSGTTALSLTGWFYCDALAYGQGYMGFRSGAGTADGMPVGHRKSKRIPGAAHNRNHRHRASD